MPKIQPNAPRFQSLLERYEDRQILLMKRRDWEAIRANGGGIVSIKRDDLEAFPFYSHFLKPKIVGANIHKTAGVFKIKIYRYDATDAPTPYNVDEYEVWEEIPPIYNIGQMVVAASTDNDENFSNYLQDHVFLRKRRPEEIENHWLPELPLDVELYFEISEE